MRPTPSPVVACALAAAALAACARDPLQVAWDDAFEAALREPPAARAERMAELGRTAPRLTDRGEAERESAMALEDWAEAEQREPLEAARRWAELGERGARRLDRARAHYQLGRIAERTGRLAAAEAIDKALVETYPELMPGERALAHLARRARASGDAAMDALLAWLRARPAILDGPLGDNALYLAAEEAERRWRRDRGEPATAPEARGAEPWAATAEALYRELADRYPSSSLWNDALWNLSLMDHDRGRFEDELALIRRIQRSRAPVSLFGQNEHEYYWKGQLRVARVEWLDLHRPIDAAASYLEYRRMFPMTNRHDDVLFFAGCALRDAGRSPDALWGELAKGFPESRYLRRLPSPDARACTPPEVAP